MHLGALGALTRLTLDVEPDYDVRQRVFEGLEWDALFEHYDEITAAGYSVSVFSRWGEATEQVWIKSRVTDAPEEVRDELFGAPAATVHRHPILGLDPVNCCPQLGIARALVRPAAALPHGLHAERRRGAAVGVPPAAPPRGGRDARAAPALRGDASAHQVTEFRTIAADRLWMSAQYERETDGVPLHLGARPAGGGGGLADVEEALAPFGARPHWGKLFCAEAPAVAPLFPRLPEFAAPHGAARPPRRVPDGVARAAGPRRRGRAVRLTPGQSRATAGEKSCARAM